ncbi:MAG: bacteriocin [Erysipelotrichaceae bacterium]|nr:bacteriocin [Erysipelotrichaceae bacterium]
MKKTEKELNELKQEFTTLTNKLNELTEDELKEVIGGDGIVVGRIDFELKEKKKTLFPIGTELIPSPYTEDTAEKKED